MDLNDYLMQTGSFRMIDKINSIEYKKAVETEKYVSKNEFWVKDHFPDYPIFPGVLLLEAMGQTGGLLLYKKQQKKRMGF